MSKWYYSHQDERLGPIELNELRKSIQEGKVNPNELAWTDGMTDWQPIHTLPELLPQSPPVQQRLPVRPYEAPSRTQQNIDRRYRDDESSRTDYDEVRPNRAGLQPHRATLVFVLGLLGVIFCVMFWIGSPLFFGLTIPAFIMGKKDLKAIKEGRMDPSGEGLTRAGYVLGIVGTILASLCSVGAIGYVAFFAFMVATGKIK